MKNAVVLILLLSSFSTFSSDAGALDALRTLFREGFYFGITPENDLCTVRFQYFSDRAVITSTNRELSVSRVVLNGSAYRFQSGRKEFLSSDSTGTFRSLAVNETDTYTVTAIPRADGGETFVECIIPLEL